MLKKFPHYKQLDSMDCGPTCLRMVAKYYGKHYSLPYLRDKCYIDKEGVSLKGICEAAETIGFRTLAVKVPYAAPKEEASLLQAKLPAIVHWNNRHFVVLYKMDKKNVWIADPSSTTVKLKVEEFNQYWIQDNKRGVALMLEPGSEFFKKDDDDANDRNLSYLMQYLAPHKKLGWQLILGLVLGAVFQLIFPFLTQSLVDIGIDSKNLTFIHLVLIGQLMLFVSQTAVRFIQSWIMLHISIRVNVNLISDFLIKLMKLPLGFFDSKHIGDLLQRVRDHKRVETFLTQSSTSILLSFMNFVIFGIVLLVYSIPIFFIFLSFSFLYIGWILLFLKKRKEIDQVSFYQLSNNENALIEIIQGMPEIKLQGSQLKRRWKWADIQAKLFRIQTRSLSIIQYQDAGALSLSQLKDILITFIAAKAVLAGSMTLGMMLAIQYIIGQLNGPLQQLIAFIRAAQDAQISLERLNEIHSVENEEQDNVQKMMEIPSGDIVLENVSFRYSPITDYVLQDINLQIPRGKTTAIVGTSGSGKTTLIKLLLGFYHPIKGRLMLGHMPIDGIYQKKWRKECGVVMQEGFVFSDSIANNIAESDDTVDYSKLLAAATAANIMDFIHSLALGFNTMIGARGNGLSQGQKQRLLIARAIYKNPEFLFFDEATNALDANNEKIIMENLQQFLKGKTAIVVAHRLSTVKNADQIVVLEEGRIVEIGNHHELVRKQGAYYTLVKNQLELGN